VFDAAGRKVGNSECGRLTEDLRRQLPPEALPPSTPRVEITVNGKMHVEQGCGEHTIKNKAGKPLRHLDIAPLSRISGDAVKPPATGTSDGSDKSAHRSL